MRIVLGLLVWIILVGQHAHAGERIALVIGNSAYSHATPLSNPANDAAAISAGLLRVGFEVSRLDDASFDAMRSALSDFRRMAVQAEVAIIYFAGHGIEVNRQNYLLPVDADPEEPGDLVFQGLSLDVMRRAVQPAKRLSLVILDACRNNPFVERMQALAGSRALGVGRGLSRAVEAGQNELVAFAAKEGTVAEDGAGANSPYAAALAAKLTEPGLEIGQLFREVRDEVLKATDGRQEPAVYGSLSAEQFFFIETAIMIPSAPAPAQSPDSAEVAYVTAIAGSERPDDYADYLERWPNGFFAGAARRRLAELSQSPAPTAGPEQSAAPAPEEKPETLALAPPPEDAAAELEPETEAQAFRPSRSQIREAQARLNILGLDAGPTDGLMGRRTANAISRYQNRKKIARTGTFSEDLLSMLSRDVSRARLDRYMRQDIPSPATEGRNSSTAPSSDSIYIPQKLSYESHTKSNWLRCYDPDRNIVFTHRPYEMSNCGPRSYRISDTDFIRIRDGDH